jgi:DNA-binding beta-propeller fold protein YncE
MSIIVTFTAIGYTAISYFNLSVKVAAPVKRLDPNASPVFSHLLYGDFSNTLDKPMDVAKVGELLYVTDTNNKRVQVFDISGTPIFQFGKEGKKPGEFMFPYGISGDKKGYVYIADLYNGNISIFNDKGEFISYFKESNDKEKNIESPAGLRIFDEKIYVTDIKKNKVFVFDLKGKKLMEIGNPGNEEGQFRAPNAVVIDKDNNIFVSDSGNQRVQVFTNDGKFIRSINGSKDGKGSPVFVNPRGIGIDSRGILYVVNNLTHYIYAFNEKGEEVFQFGGMGDGNEQFYLPNGLFIDENDQVYITDTLNQRVALYY